VTNASNARIIAEADPHGHWSAWLEPTPQQAFIGDTLAAAVGRLLMARRWNPGMLKHETSADQRRVFRVRITSGTSTSPD
jgi:hypothetical protein